MRSRSHPDHSARRRIATAAGFTALALCAGAIVATPAQAAPPANPGSAGRTVDINLVTVNDFHGRIEQNGTAAGIARLSTAVKAIRAENPNTVFAAAGDMIGASTFTSFIQQDVPTIEALNAAGLDVSAVGNHEFDAGFADLTDRVMPMADWEYLGANVYEKDTTNPALPEYWIAKFDGVRIGFVGAVTDELPSLVSPAGIEDITVGSPVEAANRVADQLSDGRSNNGEADIVVMLVHEGAATTDIKSATDTSTRFGQIVVNANKNIDAIVSGHTHLAYNHEINGRPVISSGQYGERFSNMEINYDRKSKQITSMENTIYTMATKFNPDGTVAAYYTEPDPAVVPIVTEATAVAAELGSVVLGTANADFGRAVRANPVGAASFPENRGGESTLGNFVADVQKWSLNEDATRNVQITFMNPGGLRADLASGEVTFAEAAAVQPFANTLVSMTLTGQQIKDVLEQQWQPTSSTRPFLKLGISAGFTYTYDPAITTPGQRITQMWLDGVPISLTDTYSVGMNSFLASGGDNFTAFRGGVGTADSGKIDLVSMVDYFDFFGSAAPDLKQRAVGVSVPGGTTVAAGSTVTVNLSSLAFSRAEAAAVEAVVSQGGTAVSAPITTVYTPNYDEIGTASVTFTVPVTASGATVFDISVPSTGTTSEFTLNVTAP